MNRAKHKKVFQYGNFDQSCFLGIVRSSYYGYRAASYKSYGENTDVVTPDILFSVDLERS